MKTCKDCIYFVDHKWCYLNPRPVVIITSLMNEIEDHWCGQLKEKATIDKSDLQWTEEEIAKFKERNAKPLKINKIKQSHMPCTCGSYNTHMYTEYDGAGDTRRTTRCSHCQTIREINYQWRDKS